MLRFSLKAIFGTVLFVAVVCAVLFAVPEYVRLVILFVGVLAMPAPLASVFYSGGRRMRACALGGLVGYGAWFVLVGVPGGFFAMDHLGAYIGTPLSFFQLTSRGARPNPFGGPGGIMIPSYLVFAWLYGPWLIVPAAVAASFLGQAITGGSRPHGDELASQNDSEF